MAGGLPVACFRGVWCSVLTSWPEEPVTLVLLHLRKHIKEIPTEY